MTDLWPQPAAERISLGDEPDFDLGGMTVRPAQRRVSMNGEQRDLQPRVMQVLVALSKVSPGVVSRERLSELCWAGRLVGDEALNRCILVLRRLSQEFDPNPFAIETVPRVGHRLIAASSGEAGPIREPTRGSRVLAAIAIAAVALAALLSWSVDWPWRASERAEVPALFVKAAANDRASLSLARELTIQLGSLGKAKPAAVKLFSEETSRSDDADLILEVGRTTDPGRVGATLALTTADRSLLWSREFEEPSNNLANLKRQAAFAAARVIECASEATAHDGPRANDLKAYVSACVALADFEDVNDNTLAMLRGVTTRSPKFAAGWARLLSAEVAWRSSDLNRGGPRARAALERDIVAARKLQPHLAEAYVAEAALLPPADFLSRSRLFDAAVANNADNAEARAERAVFLESVGLVNDAVQDGRAAVQLDPLSPAIRDTYITALAVDGRLELALEELRRAERLWPGSASLAMARYRLHLRFGDPREALRMLRSGEVGTDGAKAQQRFLEARIDPSADKVETALALSRNIFRSYPYSITTYAQALAQFDRKEELLDILLRWRRMDLVHLITAVLFRPAFDDVHRDPRFMRVAERLGLLEYWRKTNHWPAFCYATDLPYNCKVEAAKIAAVSRAV